MAPVPTDLEDEIVPRPGQVQSSAHIHGVRAVEAVPESTGQCRELLVGEREADIHGHALAQAKDELLWRAIQA